MVSEWSGLQHMYVGRAKKERPARPKTKPTRRPLQGCPPTLERLETNRPLQGLPPTLERLEAQSLNYSSMFRTLENSMRTQACQNHKSTPTPKRFKKDQQTSSRLRHNQSV